MALDFHGLLARAVRGDDGDLLSFARQAPPQCLQSLLTVIEGDFTGPTYTAGCALLKQFAGTSQFGAFGELPDDLRGRAVEGALLALLRPGLGHAAEALLQNAAANMLSRVLDETIVQRLSQFAGMVQSAGKLASFMRVLCDFLPFVAVDVMMAVVERVKVLALICGESHSSHSGASSPHTSLPFLNTLLIIMSRLRAEDMSVFSPYGCCAAHLIAAAVKGAVGVPDDDGLNILNCVLDYRAVAFPLLMASPLLEDVIRSSLSYLATSHKSEGLGNSVAHGIVDFLLALCEIDERFLQAFVDGTQVESFLKSYAHTQLQASFAKPLEQCWQVEEANSCGIAIEDWDDERDEDRLTCEDIWERLSEMCGGKDLFTMLHGNITSSNEEREIYASLVLLSCLIEEIDEDVLQYSYSLVTQLANAVFCREPRWVLGARTTAALLECAGGVLNRASELQNPREGLAVLWAAAGAAMASPVPRVAATACKFVTNLTQALATLRERGLDGSSFEGPVEQSVAQAILVLERRTRYSPLACSACVALEGLVQVGGRQSIIHYKSITAPLRSILSLPYTAFRTRGASSLFGRAVLLWAIFLNVVEAAEEQRADAGRLINAIMSVLERPKSGSDDALESITPFLYRGAARLAGIVEGFGALFFARLAGPLTTALRETRARCVRVVDAADWTGGDEGIDTITVLHGSERQTMIVNSFDIQQCSILVTSLALFLSRPELFTCIRSVFEEVAGVVLPLVGFAYCSKTRVAAATCILHLATCASATHSYTDSLTIFFNALLQQGRVEGEALGAFVRQIAAFLCVAGPYIKLDTQVASELEKIAATAALMESDPELVQLVGRITRRPS